MVERRNFALYELWKRDPDLARRRLRKAIRGARGNLFGAARLLGISPRTVRNWVNRCALGDYLEGVRAELGPEFGERAYWLERSYARKKSG